MRKQEPPSLASIKTTFCERPKRGIEKSKRIGSWWKIEEEERRKEEGAAIPQARNFAEPKQLPKTDEFAGWR